MHPNPGAIDFVKLPGCFFPPKNGPPAKHTSNSDGTSLAPWLYGRFQRYGKPPKSSILTRFSIINHPFWGPTPIFGNIHISANS